MTYMQLIKLMDKPKCMKLENELSKELKLEGDDISFIIALRLAIEKGNIKLIEAILDSKKTSFSVNEKWCIQSAMKQDNPRVIGILRQYNLI